MIESMQMRWGIPGAITVTAGTNDLPKVVMTHASGAQAEVYLHGAHVASWTTPAGEDLFFVSRASHFAPDKPIRGGIPVIFPQFGGGPLPQHGLARTSDWQLHHASVQETGEIVVALRLTDSPETLALWPHPFRLELAIRLAGDTLTVMLQAANTGDRPFLYHAVLHTYFAVADIARTAVHGLDGVTYIDSLRDDIREVETRPAIRFAEETDRIYVDAPDSLQIDDEGHQRIVTIEKRNMPDVVVWNPWIAKAQRMADFGDEEYLHMVCVETGNMDAQRVLLPGETWLGETIFSYRCRSK